MSTATPSGSTPWQLLTARAIAVFAVLCHLGAAAALVGAYTIAPERPAWAFTGLAVVNVLSCCVMGWTVYSAFRKPRASMIGFQVLLGLLVVTLALLPSTYASARMALLWGAAAGMVLQGALLYGMPLALLLVLRRRGQI